MNCKINEFEMKIKYQSNDTYPSVVKIEFQNQMNLNEFGNKNKCVTAVWFHSGRRLDDKVTKS